MRVTVLLFARLREIAGMAETRLAVPEPARIGDVWAALSTAHPALQAFAPAVSCARNAEFASMHTELHDGDEVAFLPPVSGGGGSASRMRTR